MSSFRTVTAVAAAGTAAAFVVLDVSFNRPIAAKIFLYQWLVYFSIWNFYAWLIYPFFVSPFRHLPQAPGGSIFYGHTIRLIQNGMGNEARTWLQEIGTRDVIVFRTSFNYENIFVNSPDLLGELLVTKSYDFQKPQFLQDVLGLPLGRGLILAEGDQHKTQRRNLSPAFAFRHIKDLYPLFWQKGREVTQAMMASIDADGNATVNISNWGSRVALDVIGAAGLGRDFEAIKNQDNEIVQAYMLITHPSPTDRLLVIFCDYIGNLAPGTLLWKLPLPRIWEIKRCTRLIRSVCRDLIQAKRAKLEQDKLEDVDILSTALRSNLFTEEGLVNQLMNFLGAGHETTGSAMAWAIYLLCVYPDTQKRLRDEIRNNLPSIDDETPISSTDIDRLPYLNAVCIETVRVYSPIPNTMRVAVRDTSLGDIPIAKGTRIAISPWGTQADPAFWGDDPVAFRPERWLTAENGGLAKTASEAALGGAKSNYSFLSFLHGPRSCIGQSFARGEMACVLANWIGRFEFELKDKTLMNRDRVFVEQLITAKPENDILVLAKAI